MVLFKFSSRSTIGTTMVIPFENFFPIREGQCGFDFGKQTPAPDHCNPFLLFGNLLSVISNILSEYLFSVLWIVLVFFPVSARFTFVEPRIFTNLFTTFHAKFIWVRPENFISFFAVARFAFTAYISSFFICFSANIAWRFISLFFLYSPFVSLVSFSCFNYSTSLCLFATRCFHFFVESVPCFFRKTCVSTFRCIPAYFIGSFVIILDPFGGFLYYLVFMLLIVFLVITGKTEPRMRCFVGRAAFFTEKQIFPSSHKYIVI